TGEAREHVLVRQARRSDEHVVEREAEHADGRFRRRVRDEQIAPPLRPPARQPRAERQAAHEDREHQRLRIRPVPEEPLEVTRPDRLVDEPRESGRREQREEHPARAVPRRRGRLGRILAPLPRQAISGGGATRVAHMYKPPFTRSTSALPCSPTTLVRLTMLPPRCFIMGRSAALDSDGRSMRGPRRASAAGLPPRNEG